MDRGRLFIFDLGDVILLGARRLRDIASELGIDGDLYVKDYNSWSSALMCGYVTTADYHRHVERTFNVRIEGEPFCENYHPEKNDYLLSVVKKLKERGNRVVIGSNTFHVYHEYMVKDFPEVLSAFDEIYLSCDIHLEKPTPAFFKFIMAREGYDESNTLFIDDRRENTDSASALGISSLLYKRDDSASTQAFFSPFLG